MFLTWKVLQRVIGYLWYDKIYGLHVQFTFQRYQHSTLRHMTIFIRVN